MNIDVAIIGAGPYGLSLAAHLSARRIEFRIFGKPMESWKTGMPPGMLLKSWPWASCLYDPERHFTVRQFRAEQEAPYHDTLMALPLESFVAYGEAFQQRYVPGVEQKALISLKQGPQGFIALFNDGELVNARRVVLAIGLYPFKHTPEVVNRLPAEALSHSGDYGPLGRLRGQRVAVLGSGASACDLVALLHEQGTAASLVARTPDLRFACPPRSSSHWEQLVEPTCGIGSGWVMKFCSDAPWLTHMLPPAQRLRLARVPGPVGGAFMKDRVIGKVPRFLGRNVESAEFRGGTVRLRTVKQDGAKETLEADHVVSATGYRIDIGRLPFLDAHLRMRIRRLEGAPVLSTKYESSVPGLHFIGPVSANSFGPVARFVFGAIHPSHCLARELSRRLGRRSARMSQVSAVMSPALR